LLSLTLFGYIRAEFSVGAVLRAHWGLVPNPAMRVYRETGSNPEKGEFQ
jgi:hypothetical protein